MKLVFKYAKKNAEPELVCMSQKGDEIQKALESVKDEYLSEVWTLGMRLKAHYGEGKPAVAEKPKPKAKKKSEAEEG